MGIYPSRGGYQQYLPIETQEIESLSYLIDKISLTWVAHSNFKLGGTKLKAHPPSFSIAII